MGIFGTTQDTPRPDFSNLRGGSSSTARTAKSSSGDASTAPTERLYIVAKGDSLSAIAKRFYGDGSRWRWIYDANRDLIEDPDLIYPGQRLRIPY